MSKMIELETRKSQRDKGFGYEHCVVIRKSMPFVESTRGEYTHRVRTGILHKHPKSKESHMSFTCWCGVSVLISSNKRGRLVEKPSEGRPICATCEGKATGAGLLGAREINGHSVMYRPMDGKKQ